MLKVALFRGEDESGQHAIPLHQTESFEKTAASLLPDVQNYIRTLRPVKDAQYVLVNALGAGEYYGSNINGDFFSEAALVHAPSGWKGIPVHDAAISKDWPYGYPTFYGAHPYAHHKNKDPSRAFGEVELSAWNPHMKRVELVVRIDRDKCYQFGASGVWDKIQAGGFPDVSMGCFPAGTLITMGDGTRRPIESIQVGDEVLTHKGRVRKVTELHRRHYSGVLHTIRAEAHRALRATRQHPFYVVPEHQVKEKDSHSNLRWSVSPDLSPTWESAEGLSLDSYLLEPVSSEENQEGVASTMPKSRAFARLLGYYLAEGHLLRNKKKEICGIELTAHRDDPVHAEIDSLCQDFGTTNTPAYHARDNSENAVGIYVFDRELAELCAKHAGSYSEKKRLSKDVMSWPTGLQRHLLGAYANGDGCGPEDGSLKFSTASCDLSWQINQLLLRCGFIPSWSELHHKATGKSTKPTTEYVVHIGKQHATKLSSYCSKVKAVEVLKAKNSRVFAREGESQFVVTPIRELTAFHVEMEVFNFEVEEDNSYVAEGIAVHNCKVPFDLCSICTDWKSYNEALATFNPSKHKHVGDAVLEFHRTRRKIRGLSITRKDYCEHARNSMNKILPDGRKVFVLNEQPKFFDISFVFIGADKTAKTMLKIASDMQVWAQETVEVSTPEVGPSDDLAKTASVGDDLLKSAFGKAAKDKQGEIVKDVVPSQFSGKAVPILTKREKDLPDDALEAMAALPLGESLSTAGAMGLVVRPREFQRIVLIRMGHRNTAKELEERGLLFPHVDDITDAGLSRHKFSLPLAKVLLPFMEERSLFGPSIERRIIVVAGHPERKVKEASSLSSPLMLKMGSTYNGYRKDLTELIAYSQTLLQNAGVSGELQKVASAPVEDIFTPLSVAYLHQAFRDELPIRSTKTAHSAAGVEKGSPFEEHVNRTRNASFGGSGR